MKPLNTKKALVRPTKSFYAEADEAESVLFLGTCLASANVSVDPTSYSISKGRFLQLRGADDAEPNTAGRSDAFKDF